MENEIIKKLTDKKLSDKTVKLYTSILKNLNDKKIIKNFKFLEKPKKILDKIKNNKLTTQRSAITAIVSTLKAFDDPTYKLYIEHMNKMNKEIEATNGKNIKTETQKKNWIEWDEVEKIFYDKLKSLKISKNVSKEQYDNLLSVVCLALYVLIPPRRSKDFILMKNKLNLNNQEIIDNDKFNYLDMKKKQFIFNNYKTNKTYGKQIVDIPNNLYLILKKFLNVKKSLNLDNEFLLTKFDNENLKSDNSITRLLNDIFNRCIGPSMLRHIYLTSKYGNFKESMKKDAELMAHSVTQQEDYIKK